jgi:hypothetical protein
MNGGGDMNQNRGGPATVSASHGEPPARASLSPGARVLRALVRFYRLFFSAWLGAGCRYVPSCSQYAIGALERHGALGGSYLAAWRVLRCHPGCAGGRDEVPEHLPRPRLFAFLDARTSRATTAPGRPSPETTP